MGCRRIPGDANWKEASRAATPFVAALTRTATPRTLALALLSGSPRIRREASRPTDRLPCIGRPHAAIGDAVIRDRLSAGGTEGPFVTHGTLFGRTIRLTFSLLVAVTLPALGQSLGAGAPSDREIEAAMRANGMDPREVRERMRGTEPEAASTNAAASRPFVPRLEPAIVPDTLARVTRPAPVAGEPLGFEIFRWAPTTFEPLTYGPVGEDYPLGPGDELTLTLWGDAQLALSLTVTREGSVTLPDVGQVAVSGLPLGAARERIRAALARVYSGLRGTNGRSTTSLSLSLGKLRSIQVFLLGDVVRPGGYTLSAVSRALNALYAAGGPTLDGSLRDVRILRGGQVVAHIDLYDVILKGAGQEMTRLENGDVVFVPPATRRVSVSGPLRRSGRIELKDGEELRDLLRIAGGVLPEADVTRAQIDRIVPAEMREHLAGQGRIAIDVPLAQVLSGQLPDVALRDSDSLRVFELPQRRTNTVNLTGRGVLRPGVYQYRDGMKVSELIALAGGVTPDAYLDRAQVVRTLRDSTRASLRFVPSLALSGDAVEDFALMALDDVSIRSKWDLEERQLVTVHGLVRSPGRYELLDGMTLTDLLMRAGGFTDDAYAVRAELTRVATGKRLADTLQVPLQRDLTRCVEASSFALQAHDAVFIRRNPEYREPEFVVLDGEVRFPGTYTLTRRNERLSDLMKRAGGLTPEAYAQGARFSRLSGARLAIELPRAMRQNASRHDLILMPGDTLIVPRHTPTVMIEGAVLNPVTALYQPGASVAHYITQASGFRADANRRGVVVMSPSGRVRKGGRPEPGSRILVPARLAEEKSDGLKDIATVMSIVASAATTYFLVSQGGK